MVQSPSGKLCLVVFKVNPFEIDIDKYVTWEVAGMLESLNGDPIDTDKIIVAKLLQGQQGDNFSVIVQYDGHLLALRVVRRLASQVEQVEQKKRQV